MHRLAWMDRPTGRVIRRYERDAPGELIHIDVKKLGRIPPGGGHRVLGRSAATWQLTARSRGGYDFVHAAIDDHSRLAYVEVHADELGTACAAFLRRAQASRATSMGPPGRLTTGFSVMKARRKGYRPGSRRSRSAEWRARPTIRSCASG
jgi:hypothetical protein